MTRHNETGERTPVDVVNDDIRRTVRYLENSLDDDDTKTRDKERRNLLRLVKYRDSLIAAKEANGQQD